MSDIVEITTPGEWLELLFARCLTGYLSLFSVEKTTGFRHVDWAPAADPGMLADAADSRAASCDVWYGVATRAERLGGGKRGGGSACALLPALFADLDVAGPNHKINDRLPKTLEEAMALLFRFPIRPSALVYTGGGIQPYWFLKDPLPAHEAKVALTRWEHKWKTLAAEKQLHIDSVFSLEHVFRVPGTWNRKHEPVAIYAKAYPERIYDFAELDVHLTDPPKKTPPKSDPTSNGHHAGGDRPGDAFNAAHTGGEVLAARGFTLARQDHDDDEHWSWPHAESATSATVYAEDGHTTIWSETFVSQYPKAEVRRPYDPFGLLTVCFFDGDHGRAGMALVDQGYGRRHIPDLSWLRPGDSNGSGDQAADDPATPADEWPAPVPLTGPEVGPPFDVNWLPRVVRDHVVALARETQTPPGMAARDGTGTHWHPRCAMGCTQEAGR